MVQPDGLRVVKGLHYLGCVGFWEESWWIGIVVGVEPEFWATQCGEWIAKRVRSSCGLIASARGLHCF
jgi:hypothetical protein